MVAPSLFYTDLTKEINVSALDYIITITYLTAIVLIGIFAQRRAKAGIDSYFLGGSRFP